LDKGLSFTEASNGYFLHNAVPFAVLGALILWRRPGHAIGWVLVLIGGLDAFTHIGDEYELFEFGELAGYPSVLSVEQVVGWLWVPVVALVGMALPQLFPDGRLLSRRWRPLAGFCAVATAVLSVLFIMDPTGNGMDPVLSLVFPAYGLAMLLSLVPLFTRFRRTSGVERQQLKWVFYGLAVSVPLGTAGVTWGANAAWSLPALVILPASITVAVLRYRLFDVDVVISRTLLVAGLAGFITVAYVGIVVGVGSLIGQGDEPDLVLSVLATALVAVAFQPIRRGLQRVANRLVFGRRATPYDVLSGFATRVGAAEPSSDTLVQLAELMAGGTGADPARVWLRVGTQLRPAATWPPVPAGTDVRAPAAVEVDPDSSTPSLPDVDLAVPVREQGELLGMLTIAKPRGERVTEIDSELLGRLAAASGVVLRNLRLDAELAQRLTDLEASRRRLLSAQNDARQRIEADLAGGSRAQLCVLRDRLSGLARDVDLRATPKTSLLLGQLVAATDGALETLDGLAAGVYPPRLAADGLGSALTEQAAKAALPISVHAAGVGRYPAEVEAAVYFGVLEALQNVAKYATASSAQVRLRHDRDRLLFEVTDDGVGFDPSATRLGTGLQGMADRLDTVGGRLTVDSTPGAGTAITGEVPVVLAPPPRDLEAALVGGSQ
jgi:signal transduction histidine kinase